MEMPYNYVQQGWQCPVCGKVHAPWVSACDCHITIAKETPTTNIDYARQESITVCRADQPEQAIVYSEDNPDGELIDIYEAIKSEGRNSNA